MFILGCSLVYTVVALLLAQAHGRSISDGKRRWLEYEGEHRPYH